MKVNIDFSKVKDFGEAVPEGTYLVKIKKVEVKDGDQAKYFAWESEIADGDYKGSKIWWNTSLAPNALFNLRNMIEACGIEVPRSKFQVDTDLLLGKTLGVIVEHDVYKGKTKANVTGYCLSSEVEGSATDVPFGMGGVASTETGTIDLDGLDL